MTQDDFIKTDLNAPLEYSTCVIHMTGVDHWDNIATTIYVAIECQDAEGNVLHKVASTANSKTDLRLADALIKDIKAVAGIFYKIPRPSDKCILYIHDISAYLLLTKQIPIYSNTLETIVKTRSPIAKRMAPVVEVRLGGPELKREFVDYMFDMHYTYEKISHTFEKLGYNLTAYCNEQIKLREELKLWQKK